MTAPAPASLGITAKSIHAAAGRSASKRAPADPAAAREGLRTRYALQRKLQSVLYRPELPASEQHRACWCHRSITDYRQGSVQVLRRADGGSARLIGVQTCGNARLCPVCGPKVGARRREELELAHVRHVRQGRGLAYLLTLTFPHGIELRLSEAEAKLTDAIRRFKNSRTWKRMRARGALGYVSSSEETFGALNGWHPHQHVLLFGQRDTIEGRDNEAGDLVGAHVDELKAAWLASCRKAGIAIDSITDFLDHGLRVQGGIAAAEYVAKFGRETSWSLSAEMTARSWKAGRLSDHYTPPQLLALAHAGISIVGRGETFDPAALILDYAGVYKGKRLLTWTPGLKAALGIDDIDDEAIAADTSAAPEESEVATITTDQLASLHARRALGEFLAWCADYCDAGDALENQRIADDAIRWLMEDRPPTALGVMRVGGTKNRNYVSWTKVQ